MENFSQKRQSFYNKCFRKYFSFERSATGNSADNGKEFTNLNFNDFCNKWKIKIIHGTPGKHHSQGLIEGTHQTIIKNLVSKILEVKSYDYTNIEKDY